MKALLVSYGEVLFRHPEIARMAMSTQPSGPNYLALADAILGLLDEGGVSGREAAWGMDLLLLHPTAVAVEHSSPKSATQESDEFSALAAKIATADPARYPTSPGSATRSCRETARAAPTGLWTSSWTASSPRPLVRRPNSAAGESGVCVSLCCKSRPNVCLGLIRKRGQAARAVTRPSEHVSGGTDNASSVPRT